MIARFCFPAKKISKPDIFAIITVIYSYFAFFCNFVLLET